MRARFLRWLLGTAYRLLTRLEVRGLENIPPTGPYILASNHMSRFDSPLLYGLIGGDHITAWVGEKYRRNLFFGTIVRLGNPIFIRRGEVDRRALEAAVEALQSGKAFGLSPEGTRSRVGSLIRAKTGIAYLADKTDAPIVPVAFTGTESLGHDLLRFRRAHLTIQFGQPFHLPALNPDDRSASMRRNVDEVMCRLAAMLPPKYHGVYADHPRLQELLKATQGNPNF